MDNNSKGLLYRLENYISLKGKCESQISNAERAITEMQAEIEKISGGVDETNEFISKFKQYHGLTKLTREVLVELVDNIYIHEGGAIEIHLKCRDEFLAATEFIYDNVFDKISV